MPIPRTLLKYTGRLLLLALVPAALVAGGLLWLIGSQGGTRFLAGQASGWLGDAVQWEALEGRLAGPLELRGLAVSLPTLELELERLAFDWRPGALLRGELHVTRLVGEGGHVRVAPGEEPAAAEPFDPGSLRAPLDLRIAGVELRDFVVSRADAPEPRSEQQRIDALLLDAALAGDALSVTRLELQVPEGRLTAQGEAVLRSAMPLGLEAAWEASLPAPEGLGAARALRGELAAEGTVAWGPTVAVDLRFRTRTEGLDALAPELPPSARLEGRLQGEQRGDALHLEALRLELDDLPLAVTLAGTVPDLNATPPVADLTLAWRELAWPLGGAEPTVRSRAGELALRGSPAGYDLSLDAEFAAAGLPPGRWQLAGRGDSESFTLEGLRAEVLGGELRASGPVRWHPAPGWALEVEGEGLNPGVVHADVPGKLSLALYTAGRLDPDTGIDSAVTLRELHGMLLDRPLRASANARLTGETLAADALSLVLESLSLASEGNALTARGTLSPETVALHWELTAADPAALLAGAEGRLTGAGKVTGTREAPRLTARFEGASLALDTLALDRVQGSLEAGLDPEAPLAVTLTAGALRSAGQSLLEGSELELAGTLARHALRLEARSAGARLSLALDGGLDGAPGDGLALTAERWSGLLRGLTLASEGYGSWRLRAPATLALAADVVALGETCLERDDGEGAVCLAGETAAGESAFAAAVEDLPATLFVPTLTGALAGDVEGTLAADGALALGAGFRLASGTVRVPLPDGEEALAHGGGELRLTVDAAGLLAVFEFAAPEQGQVNAEIRLPRLTALPPSDVQPLEGRAQATLPRLDALAAWLPELERIGGRLNADFRLGGTLAAPSLAGELGLAEGQAAIPLAGITLREAELQASSDPSRPAQLLLRGGLRSGEGRLALEGAADLASGAVTLDLEGERLLVYDTPDARALLSPDVELAWRDETLRLRGVLRVPEASITPRLGLRTATAPGTAEAVDAPGEVLAPSPDVVIVNAGPAEPEEAPPAAVPFRIDSRVRVILGDRVRIDALGFKSRLAGAVTFTNAPESPAIIPIADGRIEVQEGTFRAFGQDLEIETGQLLFARVPASEPELTVRAVRWIDDDPEVTAAGVLLTGPATEPELELFSRPQLAASEIQSYLLTGTSASERSTRLSIGTYLSPRFYVGYGFNLLEATSEFNSLFDITPRYGISANAGEADSNINLTVTYEN